MEVRGHAYPDSNFPPPGGVWNGLMMGENMQHMLTPSEPLDLVAISDDAQVILTLPREAAMSLMLSRRNFR
jgi:hypothetical protein